MWPTGIVGSITHSQGDAACAVASGRDVGSIGIDIEPHLPLPHGVLKCLDRLVFTAKEAVYKARFPVTGRTLSFEDVELSVAVGERTFRARLLVDGPSLAGLEGRWCVETGLLATFAHWARSR